MLIAVMWGGLAAASLLIGYVLAGRELSHRTIGMIMGFGAGALISAIAYELVPQGGAGGWGTALFFMLGALIFSAADWWVSRRGGGERKNIAGSKDGSGSAIFIGTLLDNIPESVVLGMGFAFSSAVSTAFLVAVFVSNLPEGVAGTLNMQAAGRPRRRIFWMWVVLVIISAACAGVGYLIIQQTPHATGRLIQAFAAGAMLTMLADAMMPEAFEHGGKLVGLSTVMGFLAAAILAAMEG
jgi:ZIP family zinc transporter